MTIDTQTIDAAYDAFLSAEEDYIDACNQIRDHPYLISYAAYNAAAITLEDARIALFDSRWGS